MRLQRPWLLLAILLLTSCAGLLGPRQMEVPLSTLQSSLERRFPFNNRYLELFDISVTNPQISLQPGVNRVLTSMDAAIAPPFLKSALTGKLAISGALTIDPARNAVILVEPRMENMALNGLDSRYEKQVGRVVRLLAEQLLDGIAIYTFSPEDLRLAGTRYFPSGINTSTNALVVTFEPAR